MGAPRGYGLCLGALVAALCLAGREPVDAQPKKRPGKAQEEVQSMKLESPAFKHQGSIPKKYTCEGEDVAPQLVWSGVPEGAKSLVLIVDDPDAPDPRAPKMTWVHWVLFNIPLEAAGLPEGGAPLPPNTDEGLNSWKRTGYGGPCPPIGRHRYFHKLYALAEVLDLQTPTKEELEKAMAPHVLGQAVLVGTYAKQK